MVFFLISLWVFFSFSFILLFPSINIVFIWHRSLIRTDFNDLRFKNDPPPHTATSAAASITPSIATVNAILRIK